MPFWEASLSESTWRTWGPSPVDTTIWWVLLLSTSTSPAIPIIAGVTTYSKVRILLCYKIKKPVVMTGDNKKKINKQDVWTMNPGMIYVKEILDFKSILKQELIDSRIFTAKDKIIQWW